VRRIGIPKHGHSSSAVQSGRETTLSSLPSFARPDSEGTCPYASGAETPTTNDKTADELK